MDYKPKQAEVTEWTNHPVTKVFFKAIHNHTKMLEKQRQDAAYVNAVPDDMAMAILRENLAQYKLMAQLTYPAQYIKDNELMGDDHEAEV